MAKPKHDHENKIYSAEVVSCIFFIPNTTKIIYFTFIYLGKYVLLLLLNMVFLFTIGYIRGNMEGTLDKEKRVKHD